MFLENPLKKIAVERLTALAIGESLAYTDMAAAIGLDPQGEGYDVVLAARKAALDAGVVIAIEANQGYRRLSPEETVDTASSFGRRIRNTARRGFRTITAIGDGYQTLPAEKKIRHNALASIFAVVGRMTTPRAVHRVEGDIGDSIATMSRTLDAFRAKQIS